MNWYDSLDLNPLEKLWQVLGEWGDEVEHLPMEEVNNILAITGIDAEPTIRSVKDLVEGQKTEKPCDKERAISYVKPDNSAPCRHRPLWEEGRRQSCYEPYEG